MEKIPTLKKGPAGSESYFLNFNDRNLFRGNVFGYGRVSTVQQLQDGHSLAHQIDSVKKYCSSQNLNLVRIYIDGGISAKNLDKRPAALELLNGITKGDTLVITSLSRICRNIDDARKIYNDFKEKLINFVILDLQIETQSPDGELMMNIFSCLAQAERRKISERTRNVLQNMKEKGELKTKPAFGTRSLGPGLGVEPDPQALEIIEKIKELNSEGLNLNQITIYLTQNHPHPNGKVWRSTFVSKIMEREGVREIKTRKFSDESQIFEVLKKNFEDGRNLNEIVRIFKRDHPQLGEGSLTRFKLQTIAKRHGLF